MDEITIDINKTYYSDNGKYQTVMNAITYGAIHLSKSDRELFEMKGRRYYKFFNGGLYSPRLAQAAIKYCGDNTPICIAKYLEHDVDEFLSEIKRKNEPKAKVKRSQAVFDNYFKGRE